MQASEEEVSKGKFPLESGSCWLSLISFVAMQVEWAKTHARAQRYVEEEELVLEEMRRVRQYLEWKAQWWCETAGLGRESISDRVKAGCIAYAHKQAFYLTSLRIKFTDMWKSELMKLDLPVDCLSE